MAAGLLLVFDLTRRITFERMSLWLEAVEEANRSEIPMARPWYSSVPRVQETDVYVPLRGFGIWTR